MLWSGDDPTFAADVVVEQTTRPPKNHPKQKALREYTSRVLASGVAVAMFVILSRASANNDPSIQADDLPDKGRSSVAPGHSPPFEYSASYESGVFELTKTAIDAAWAKTSSFLRARGDDPEVILSGAASSVEQWRQRPEPAFILGANGLPVDDDEA